MRPDEARDIDALARARNREDGNATPEGCIVASLLAVGCWVAIAVLAARFFRMVAS
ncbi:MAG: hypothetical protein K2R93_12220 [Gemmatimonadaceae bacterium]|nr:hypothetical protein [Gemmatimonadaceae bacterium]